MPKVFNRMWKMREKSYAYTEITASLEMVYVYKVVSKYAKSTSLKNINAFGEHSENILPYMENTLIDIKVSLSR